MSILVFNTLNICTSCTDRIFELMTGEEVSKGHKVVNNKIVIKDGKQAIERWDYPAKAKDKSKWYIESPQDRYPAIYEILLSEYTFDVLTEIPADWVDDGGL